MLPVEARLLRNAIQAKDSLDIMVRERDELVKLRSFYEKLDVRDSMLIASLNKNISLADLLIANLKEQVTNKTSQKEDEKKISLNLHEIIKRKNRAIIKLCGISVSLAAAVGLLITRK
jgi:hypothetical protein